MKKYKHIILKEVAKTEQFKNGRSKIPKSVFPERDRNAHSNLLINKFNRIWSEEDAQKTGKKAASLNFRDGSYLEFSSAVNAELLTKSLEDIKKGIRLLNIREVNINQNEKQVRATVYIPRGREGYFIKKIKDYKEKDTKFNKPKNSNLVNSIEDVQIALLESLWTDNKLLFPKIDVRQWCEVWLYIDHKAEEGLKQIENFYRDLDELEIKYKSSIVIFPERAVLLVWASRSELTDLMNVSDLLAEIRAGQEATSFWINESAINQNEWVVDLLNRFDPVLTENLKVCLLDTGVNNGHPLLKPILSESDTLTIDPNWGTYDSHNGENHGTLMAGVIGFGSIERALQGSGTIKATHHLCSVKILPTIGNNQVEHWGAITSQAISRAEIQNPDSHLIFCLAISSKFDSERGRPSSWSGHLDALSFGEGSDKRIFIVSGGNVRDQLMWKNYPDSNLISSIENPSQSWNAITVGAITDKVQTQGTEFEGYFPLAEAGQLSPYSTTSTTWERKWPIKPEVVFEGGNLMKDHSGSFANPVDLEILSTSKNFASGPPFDTINATSAATAYAAWFAAQIKASYPNIWPETIRALIVHSSEWRDSMFKQFSLGKSKTDFGKLLRVFGYGIPNLERALFSLENSLTMISEAQIQPFAMKGNTPSVNEMHFYKLPWPKDVLIGLGVLNVKLRVTLSYFIEPGPGEIGWKDRYRYQSHGLRFEINKVTDTEEVFKKRINAYSREEDEQIDKSSGSERWTIGKGRNVGSIHSDIWEGSAADLSTCNMIAVFPVIGWWRERKNLGMVEKKTRYSLVISLETPKQDIELYSTVLNLIKTPIEVRTS